MKKVHRLKLAYLICLVMILTIVGCGKKDTRDFNIENHVWSFSSMVDSTTGTVIACTQAEQENYLDAQVMELTCEAKTNVMAIREGNSGNGKEISYSGIGKDTNSMTYKLILGSGDSTVEGMAVSGITEYAKGKYRHTLVIDLDGYALYFVEKTEE